MFLVDDDMLLTVGAVLNTSTLHFAHSIQPTSL